MIGLTATAAAAAAVGGIVGASHRLGAFSATSPNLAGLVTIGVGTVGVALAAGVAAALTIETRASAAVGVAISVTTIPAAAYFGVAVAVHQHSKAGGALAVLGVNVAMLLVGGSATLAVQRWLNRRAEKRAAGRLDPREHVDLTRSTTGTHRSGDSARPPRQNHASLPPRATRPKLRIGQTVWQATC